MEEPYELDQVLLVGDEVELRVPLRGMPAGMQGRVIHVAEDTHNGLPIRVNVEWGCGVKMGLIWWRKYLALVRRPPR